MGLLHKAILRRCTERGAGRSITVRRDVPEEVFSALAGVVLSNHHCTTVEDSKSAMVITITSHEKVLAIFNCWAVEESTAPVRTELLKKMFWSGSRGSVVVGEEMPLKFIYKKNSKQLIVTCKYQIFNINNIPQ